MIEFPIFAFEPDFSTPPSLSFSMPAETLRQSAAAALITWPAKRPERLLTFYYRLDVRRTISTFLATFSTLGGRHQPALVPSWTHDFNVIETAAGADTITTDVTDYATTYLPTTHDDEPGRYIFVASQTHGLHVARLISATDGSTSALTLEQPLPWTPEPSAIWGFAYLARLDQDDLEATFQAPDSMSTVLTWRTVTAQSTKVETYALEALDDVYATLPLITATQATGDRPELRNDITQALGPNNLHFTQSAQYEQPWTAWVSAGGVRLFKGIKSAITIPEESAGLLSGLFTEPPPERHISLAFDQTAREVIAYTVDRETIGVRRYFNGAVQDLRFPGQTPQLYMNGVLDVEGKLDGLSDVILFYRRRGRAIIYARAQRDNFGTEYSFAPMAGSEALTLIRLDTDLEARVMRLIAIDNHFRVTTYESDVYPIPPPPESFPDFGFVVGSFQEAGATTLELSADYGDVIVPAAAADEASAFLDMLIEYGDVIVNASLAETAAARLEIAVDYAGIIIRANQADSTRAALELLIDYLETIVRTPIFEPTAARIDVAGNYPIVITDPQSIIEMSRASLTISAAYATAP